MKKTKKIEIDTHIIKAIIRDTAAVLGQTANLKLEIGSPKVSIDGSGEHVLFVPLPVNEEGMVEVRGMIDHEVSHILHTPAIDKTFDNLEREFNNVMEDVRCDELMTDRFEGSKINIEKNIQGIYDTRNDPNSQASQKFKDSVIMDMLEGLYANSSLDVTIGKKDIGNAVEDYMEEFRKTDTVNTVKRKEILNKTIDVAALVKMGEDPNAARTIVDSPKLRRENRKKIQEGREKLEVEQQELHGGANSVLGNHQGTNTASGRVRDALNGQGKNVDLRVSREIESAKKSMAKVDRTSVKKGSAQNVKTEPELKLHYDIGRKRAHRIKRLLEVSSLESKMPDKRGRKVDKRNLAGWIAGTTDKVLLAPTIHQRLNLAVYLLVDASASMMGDKAVGATYGGVELAGAMTSLGIPFAISSFYTYGESQMVDYKDFDEQYLSGIQIQSVGGTPIAYAIMYAAGKMVNLQQKRKIIFLLTDGEPTVAGGQRSMQCMGNHGGIDGSGSSVAVDIANQMGIEVYAFLIEMLRAEWIHRTKTVNLGRGDAVNGRLAGIFITKLEELMLRKETA